MVYGDPVWKQENVYLGPNRSELRVLFWVWNKNAIWDGTFPYYILTLFYMSAGVSTDHKSSNRIKLSQLVQLVLVIWDPHTHPRPRGAQISKNAISYCILSDLGPPHPPQTQGGSNQ